MAFIRARQRVITALTPHQGNRRFIVPKRGLPGAAPADDWTDTYLVTAGSSTPQTGYYRGVAGVLFPDSVLSNAAATRIERVLTDTGNNWFQIFLDGAALPDADTVFRKVTVTGTFTGGLQTIDYTRADRLSHTTGLGNDTRWRWDIPDTAEMIDGNVYGVVFVGDDP